MLKKEKIGNVLRQRIYVCGFSQKKFAEITGVGRSTLNKYLNGSCFYSVDTLALFAETLHCSYDYLLGRTDTPEPEFESLRELTHLTDGAIERLLSAVDAWEKGDGSKLDVISNFLQNDKAMDYLYSYLHAPSGDKDASGDRVFFSNLQDSHRVSEVGYVEEFGKWSGLGKNMVRVPDLESIYLAGVLREIINFKNKLGFDLSRRPHLLPAYDEKKRG